MIERRAEPVQILLIEDEPADAELIVMGFAECHITNAIRVARTGEEGLAILRRERQFAPGPRPDLVLLDLRLAGHKDGRQVLVEIKADPELRSIPVIILTTSASDQEARESYHLLASSFITKPLEYEQLLRVVKGIGDYWLTLVRLPAEG